MKRVYLTPITALHRAVHWLNGSLPPSERAVKLRGIEYSDYLQVQRVMVK